MFDEIEKLYKFNEDEWHSKQDILKFIKDNNLTDILIDAPSNIREVFGDDIRLVLELLTDPEEDWTELFIKIKTKYSGKKVVKLESKLFYKWWVTIMDEVWDKLNFTSEPL